jgi:hypothetical protein
MSRVFICTSFSTKVDQSGNVTPKHRKNTEQIINHVRKAGYECFCALEDEGWKITTKDAAQEFQYDLEQLVSSDIMLVILDNDVSAGVQIEVGYMLRELSVSPHKRIVLAHPAGIKLSWSNAAISTLPGVSQVRYSDTNDIIAALA